MDYRQWHVGMKVVCVQDELDGAEPPFPVRGTVYTISWIGMSGGFLVIDLVELPNPETVHFWRGYRPEVFRPVETRTTDISIFQAMLTPKRETERA